MCWLLWLHVECSMWRRSFMKCAIPTRDEAKHIPIPSQSTTYLPIVIIQWLFSREPWCTSPPTCLNEHTYSAIGSLFLIWLHDQSVRYWYFFPESMKTKWLKWCINVWLTDTIQNLQLPLGFVVVSYSVSFSSDKP